MCKLVHASGRKTHSCYTLESVARDQSAEGFAPAWKSGDYTRLEALRRSGFVAECRGPRGGARYKITEAGRAALAEVAEVPK